MNFIWGKWCQQFDLMVKNISLKHNQGLWFLYWWIKCSLLIIFRDNSISDIGHHLISVCNSMFTFLNIIPNWFFFNILRSFFLICTDIIQRYFLFFHPWGWEWQLWLSKPFYIFILFHIECKKKEKVTKQDNVNEWLISLHLSFLWSIHSFP